MTVDRDRVKLFTNKLNNAMYEVCPKKRSHSCLAYDISIVRKGPVLETKVL